MKKSPAEKKELTPLAIAFKTWWEREGMKSPTEFAKYLGIPYQKIQHVMNGTGQPRWLPDAAKKLGTTSDDLLAGKVPQARREGAGLDINQASSSVNEPVEPQIHGTTLMLSREQIRVVCDNLSDDQTQLLARLMVALGWVPGIKVEVGTWIRNDLTDSQRKMLGDGMPSQDNEAISRAE